jgi:hypothetical protein
MATFITISRCTSRFTNLNSRCEIKPKIFQYHPDLTISIEFNRKSKGNNVSCQAFPTLKDLGIATRHLDILLHPKYGRCGEQPHNIRAVFCIASTMTLIKHRETEKENEIAWPLNVFYTHFFRRYKGMQSVRRR